MTKVLICLNIVSKQFKLKTGAPAERGQWVPLHPLRFLNKQKKYYIILYIFNFFSDFFSKNQ